MSVLHGHISDSPTLELLYMWALSLLCPVLILNGGRVKSRPWIIGVIKIVCWLVGCLTSQQQASASQGRICSDNFTCCHTEIEVADPTIYLTQSRYTDTGPTSPSADPIMPGAWQGSHWRGYKELCGTGGDAFLVCWSLFVPATCKLYLRDGSA